MKNTNEYKQIFLSMEKIYLKKGFEELQRQYNEAMKIFNRSLKSAIARKEICEKQNCVFVGKSYSYDYEMALSGVKKHTANIERAKMVMEDLKTKYGF